MVDVIHYNGLTLHPLTTAIVVARPQFDPWQRDERILRMRGDAGWRDLEGKTHPVRLIRDVAKADDSFYYWDGPWGALSGSAGIAIVRDGQVVDTFTLWVS